MTNLPNKVSNQTKIRFQDCDPFNHLNNGSYIDYFMNHREDMLLEHYDIDVYKMASTIGKSWVSSSNQIAYLKPAFLMETVTIESQLVHYSHTELHVEMCMYNANKSELKAIIWCGFVHFNLLKQCREEHSKKLMDFFKSVHNPIDGINSFQERLSAYKKQKSMIV